MNINICKVLILYRALCWAQEYINEQTGVDPAFQELTYNVICEKPEVQTTWVASVFLVRQQYT